MEPATSQALTVWRISPTRVSWPPRITFFYQYVQSFSPQEQILPAEAHGIALELAERFFPDCEVLIATHLDTEHLHSHFIINSVQPNTGKKLHFTPKTLEKMRLVSD